VAHLVSAIPVFALIAGLVIYNSDTEQSMLSEVTEVDTALLTDDLPPAAYSDPGFIQYLKTSADHSISQQNTKQPATSALMPTEKRSLLKPDNTAAIMAALLLVALSWTGWNVVQQVRLAPSSVPPPR
jgi:hypothetical protein